MVVIVVIEVTAQSIITAAGVVTALGVLVGVLVKLVRWVDKQKAQDIRMNDLEEKHQRDMRSMQEETQLLMYGILSCLKGLQEKGCNGPVTEAAKKLEKYLNTKAHESKE